MSDEYELFDDYPKISIYERRKQNPVGYLSAYKIVQPGELFILPGANLVIDILDKSNPIKTLDEAMLDKSEL